MSRSAPHIVLFLVLLICLRGYLGYSSGVEEPKSRCKEAEKQALLRIKQALFVLSYGSRDDKAINIRLSSWGEEEEKRECCDWIGIQCSNNSGHVIKLDLSPSTFDTDEHVLGGNISSSFGDLKHLSHLDLSKINFRNFREFSSIPSSIGSLTKLRYLNLSTTGLGGDIPLQLGNLSRLQSLDLSQNHALKIKSLECVSRLSSLQVLDLSGTDMSLANDWVQAITNLPRFLTKLLLSGCNLPDTVFPTSHSLVNSSEVLKFLDLSSNSISQSIFQWLFNYNGSIVHLDLHACEFRGPVSKGFDHMTALEYLDLSYNEFEAIIPESFGSFISLIYLNLGSNQLDGFHSKSFRNMISLMHLDLSNNQLRGSIPESFGSMVSLTYLDLHGNRLDSLNLKSFLNMTAIQYLSLENNHLKGSIPDDFGNTMAFLGHLDLSSNMLEGEIPRSIWKICTLQKFVASNNSLSGELHFAQLDPSMSCANFSLEYLDLSQNKLVGPLPNFTLFPSLTELHLSFNQFSGISKSIGQLSKLEIMDISENSIQGVISEALFAKLFSLRVLDLSSNSNLSVNIPSDWIAPFRLQHILLGSCKLGPHFPKWLQTQKDHYFELNISNSGILDSIPDWLWDFNPDLSLLDLSKNEITGFVHDVKKRFNFTRYSWGTAYPVIDLSSNKLQGPVPRFLLQVASSLYLSGNGFTHLNSLCNLTEWSPLVSLDISDNQLSGELPDCWSQAKNLRILVLASNNLSGKIPVSIGFLIHIIMLHLGNNSFTAELPLSLMNCTDLVIFDVGQNKLSGPIPAWIGTNLRYLMVISLRSNHFNGSMPSQMCHSANLQVLDMSSNDLSGEIPKCLSDITAMKEIGIHFNFRYSGDQPIKFNVDELVLIWKGAIRKFKHIVLLKNIDLSSNKLTGELPRDITKLVELISFNLSRNNLSGHIPQEIGQLKSLDVLDLSNNHFSGQIPSSLSQVDRLSTLNLSSNNLSGKIPSSTQLQTRDASAFMGNPQLCGEPLPKKCPNEDPPSIPNGATEAGGDEFIISKGFYVSLALGFVVGFWGLCGTLIFNKSLRYAYLKLLDNTGDWLYVTKEVQKRKLLQLIKS